MIMDYRLKRNINNLMASSNFQLSIINNLKSKIKIADRGFTMIELLIYMGLLVILILIFTDIFVSIIDNQMGSRNTSNVANDGRYIYSRFIYDVGRAEQIIEPSTFGSTSANLKLLINSEEVTYSILNGDLLITDTVGDHKLNGYGSQVSSILFTKVGTDSAKNTVRLNFTISGLINVRGISDTQIFQTTAGLR